MENGEYTCTIGLGIICTFNEMVVQNEKLHMIPLIEDIPLYLHI